MSYATGDQVTSFVVLHLVVRLLVQIRKGFWPLCFGALGFQLLFSAFDLFDEFLDDVVLIKIHVVCSTWGFPFMARVALSACVGGLAFLVCAFGGFLP